MIQNRKEGSHFMYSSRKDIPYTVVDITSPGYNALEGRYFIGQTGELNFKDGFDAWGGLFNPPDSGVNLYFDIFTITNFSEQSYLAQIWMNAKPPIHSRISDTVTPSNQAIDPSPIPKVKLLYADEIQEPLRAGINIFDRIVTPESTLVSDSHQGSMIVGPGGTFSILLKSYGPQMITGTIVLTWWEEKIASYHHGR